MAPGAGRGSPPTYGALLVHRSDEGQVSVAFGVVESIPHYELVGGSEGHEVNVDLDLSALLLVEQ